jgi:hypothetical protein
MKNHNRVLKTSSLNRVFFFAITMKFLFLNYEKIVI